MSFITPNFGLEVPTPATRTKDLGAELLAFGLSIDEVLSQFDYNGADPNLLLSRVVALETWRTAAQTTINEILNDNRKLGYTQTLAQAAFNVAGATLTTITGAIETVVAVVLDEPTEVIINTRSTLIASTGGAQIGVNLTGATLFTTPTDDPSVGKAHTGTDVTPAAQLVRTLNAGTTMVRLAARSSGSATIRNPSILVERL